MLVIERHNELLPTIRAMVYQPVVLEVLQGLGILDKVEQHAHLNREGIYWRTLDDKELAHLPMPEGEHVLLLGQSRMNALILEEIAKYPCVKVRFKTAYAGCEQDADGKHVKVMIHETSPDKDEDIMLTTDWLIGTDGTVRRSSCIPFEGFSFTEFRMIGADVYHDFAQPDEYGTIMNFVVDSEDWAVVIYTGQQKDLLPPESDALPVWRIAYVEPTHLSLKKEDILKRARQRCARYAKGNRNLEVSRAEPYRLHQRCAAQAIKGRVLLAGDALHSNNPIGGLGLTTGICDAWAIGNALARVCTGQAPDSLVSEAANDRRETWLSATNKLSQMNLQRIRSEDSEHVRERNAFFHSLKTDPNMPTRVRSLIGQIAGKSFAVSAQA